MNKSKILVALSGGVDSAVSMALLKGEGYSVSAAYMKTWMNEEGIDVFGDCPWHQDIEDARACSEKLGVDFTVVDFIKEYREQVVEYLIGEYRAGRTPNPDIMCNRRMKFGKFLDYALSRGFDAVATGHYCSSRLNGDGSKDLLMGADPSKDQSYFLAMITQEQLQRAVFPIGGIPKPRVREIARLYGLPNADKKDSQGICFLGKIRIQDFLRYYIPENEGEIVNAAGKILGRHKGLHNYTIGQRKGIGVPSNTDRKSYVVIAKDFEDNRLIVDFDGPNNPMLYTDTALVHDINWINKPVRETRELECKVRYRDDTVKMRFIPIGESKAQVEFEQPQRAIASGQILAIYEGDVLLGGAVFDDLPRH